MSLLMVVVGAANFALNGVSQWSSWVLVGLGIFSAVQAWRSLRGRSGATGRLAIRWRMFFGFMLGALVLGAVMGGLQVSDSVVLVTIGIYVAVTVAVLLLLRSDKPSRAK